MNDEEFHAHIKELYHPPKGKFTLIDIPEIRYMMIDGKGDPQKTGIEKAMQWLWSIAHFLIPIAKKQLGKKFAYPPIECLFWASQPENFTSNSKDKWQWRVIMVLANSMTQSMFNDCVTQAENKLSEKAPKTLRVENLSEGKCVQTLHIGDYSEIELVCKKLYTEFLPENKLTPNGYYHEIYLNDPSRTAPKNRKIVIRQPVGGAVLY